MSDLDKSLVFLYKI